MVLNEININPNEWNTRSNNIRTNLAFFIDRVNHFRIDNNNNNNIEDARNLINLGYSYLDDINRLLEDFSTTRQTNYEYNYNHMYDLRNILRINLLRIEEDFNNIISDIRS
jgi:hypothetical protein